MNGILYTKDYRRFQLRTEKDSTLVYFDDLFNPQKALVGDCIRYDPVTNTCTLVKRTIHPPLAGIMDFCSKTKYGLTGRGHFMYLFTPFNKAYPPMVVGSSHKQDGKNYIGIVEFEDWNSALPRGTLRQLLGPSGDSNAELLGLQWTYNPFKIPKHLQQEAMPFDPSLYLDRIHTPPQTFNIDPPGCKDIDDVLSLEETATHVKLWITIADVASVVKGGSGLDHYAEKQGQTTYIDGKVIQPMLPLSLSENLCSLLPGTVRPGVSLILYCKKEAPYTIQSQEWLLSQVHNNCSYEYDTFLESSKEHGINVEVLQEIAQQILPECGMDTHKWIEAFMLKYNMESAKILKRLGVGILRKHSGTDEIRWKKYLSIDSSLGFLAVSSADYCCATDKNTVHMGLQTNVYCHASSPIRRYSDLWNQRILLSWIQSHDIHHMPPPIYWLNQRQKAAKQFERDTLFMKKLLEDKECTISGVILSKEQKAKLWIPEWKRIITWKTESLGSYKEGDRIMLRYHKNENGRCWKDRLVFQLQV